MLFQIHSKQTRGLNLNLLSKVNSSTAVGITSSQFDVNTGASSEDAGHANIRDDISSASGPARRYS